MKRNVGLVLFACVAAGADGQAPADVRSWRTAHEVQIVSDFVELLRLRNLASDDANVQKSADWIAAALKRRGLETRLLQGAGGPPVVYGELRVPNATKTVVVYAHYDGQPVDEAQWKSQPWEPVLRTAALEDGGRDVDLASLQSPLDPEWRLYGRSSSDDKAPAIALLSALDALAATGRKPSVNLKVFYEGEEEAGSPHLRAVLDENKDLLRADLWLLCDGPVHQTRRPQLYFGARGVTGVELTLYGPGRVLHSGHYGNWAPNPALLAAELVSSMRDADGRILIDGFMDDVRPISAAERTALASVPNNDAELRAELKLGWSEAGGAPLAERIMLPALNIRGIVSGAVQAKAANAIPTEARVSIDFRLVPNQTPERVHELVERHLQKRGYFVVHKKPGDASRREHARVVMVDWDKGGYPAARTDVSLPVSKALVQSMSEALGKPVIAMPTLGGSIPMHVFQQALQTPIVGLPIANHDNNQHAANENIRLQNLWDGIDAYAGLLTRLGPNLEAGERR